MKRLILLALAAAAMLSVSCNKDNFTDNSFMVGKQSLDIDFHALIGDDGRYTAGITFTGAQRLLYYDFPVDDIGISGRLGTFDLPATQYFAWDYYGFESGTVKATDKDGWLILVVDGKLENGDKIKIRAKAKSPIR